MKELWARLRALAESARQETVALSWAYRDPRTPWYAKGWAILVVAYALSPIDLIPDFIPVLGYLDDLILVPLGIWVALRLIPRPVMAEARQRAQQAAQGPAASNWPGLVIILSLWVVGLGLVAWLVWRIWR